MISAKILDGVHGFRSFECSAVVPIGVGGGKSPSISLPRGLTRQKINFNKVDCATVDTYLILRLGPIWWKVREDYLVRHKRCAFITSRVSD